jgi:TonB family protein
MNGGTAPATIGRYQVLDRIGRGAMGTVYRGHDPYIGRTVAIKVLHAFDEDLRARFLQEMRSLGTLHHPNIVTIFDCGEHAERPFIVMEYVAGVTLASTIEPARPLALARALHIVGQLCTALDYAHERGIVHRDVKPANLMLDGSGGLKVVDFGIARVSIDAATQTGTVIGTPSYMAPEQIVGATIDRRTDIFAVGLVLYELLGSRQAFPGDGKTAWQIMHAVVNDSPVPLSAVVPDLPPPLERIVNRAIEKRAADRYHTLAEMAADLATVQRTLAAETLPRPPARGVASSNTVAPTVEAEPPAPTMLRQQAPPAAATRGSNASSPGARRAPIEWTLAAITLLALAGILWTIDTRRNTGTAKAVTPAATPVAGAAAKAVVATPPAPRSPATTPAVDRSAPPPRDRARSATVPAPTGEAATGAPARSGGTAPPAVGFYDQARLLLPPQSRTPDPPRAAALLQRACDDGDTRGCVDLADMLGSGGGIDRDEARAAALYRRGCDAGVGASCDKGGAMYLDGRGVTRDVALAASMLQRACDRGSGEGCNRLGVIYARGVAVNKDEARAVALYDKACAQAIGIACVNLGIAYQNGRGALKDPARARAAYAKGCDAGYNWGCNDLARLVSRGEGGERDERSAAALFQRACDSGLPEGCNELGIAYARGAGVDRDEARAAALYQRACDAGTPAGCGNLGAMYRDGRAVPRDDVRAASLFQRACDGNGPPACYALGRALMAGRGVARNEASAVIAFRKSCDGNHADGCFELASAYSRGAGVARDETEAARWYQRACDGGAVAACGTLARMYEEGRGVARDPSRAAQLARRAGAAADAPAGAAGSQPPTGRNTGAGSGSATVRAGDAPLRVGGPIPIPARIKSAPAVYPAAARVAGVEGTVSIDATLDRSGQVVATRVTESIPLLDDAAETAVRQWQFAATVVNGVAVPVVVPVSIRFSLKQPQ